MTQTVQLLGELARGSFGPRGGINQQALALAQSDVFLRPITQWLIGICGDERFDANGTRPLLPSGFGALAALAITDALTTRRWFKPTFKEHVLAIFAMTREQFPEQQVTLHTDEIAQHAAEQANDEPVECGCAAVAKAPAVMQLLIDQADEIDKQHRSIIIQNAKELLQSGYFQPNTAAFINDMAEKGVQIETLMGEHDGVVFFRNRKAGTVLDRMALQQECVRKNLPALHVFTYDEWAMRESAQKLTQSANDAALFFAGGNALMMATIRAISSPDMVMITNE